MPKNLDLNTLFSDELERKIQTLLTKLLPVLDKVEETCRGIDEKSLDQLSGLAHSLAVLPDVVDEAVSAIGLSRIGKTGEIADRLRHEIKHVSHSDLPTGTVLEVFQHGWEFEGRILRRAGVRVSGDDDLAVTGN